MFFGRPESFLYFNLTESALAFTPLPDNPTYAIKGDNATLVWEYTVDDKQKELLGIVWSVAHPTTGLPVAMLLENKSGNREYSANIPVAYKGRVSIVARSTLVIQEVTLDDTTHFYCTLKAEIGSGAVDVDESIYLIVTGMFANIILCYYNKFYYY